MASPAEAFIGQVLGRRYRLVRHLDDGHFSYVFEALDLATQKSCAVKLLNPSAATSPETVVEFETEEKLLRLLKGASKVVDLSESGTEVINATINGVSSPVSVRFHVLELADGSLGELLMNRHRLPWAMRLRLFRQIVHGAHQMHLKGVVHRDLKASNALLFETDTVTPIVKLADLGRSCLVSEPPRFSIDKYLFGRGDLSFAPPEYFWLLGDDQAQGHRRADIYLLGSVLYELATAQGITGIAIPDWRTELNKAWALPPALRSAAFEASAKSLESKYDLAIELLKNEVPPEIRTEFERLVRRMCNPMPHLRERRTQSERNLPIWGFEWAFRPLDIMILRLATAKTRAYSRARSH